MSVLITFYSAWCTNKTES